MTDSVHRVALIIGSTREGRFGPTVARWLHSQVRARGDMEADLIDLADAGLEQAFARAEPSAVASLGARLHAADAFLIVTPEYNHGYPAPLKTAIDWYQTQWHAKPVGFVSYGGISGGLRAVEQLRQVFAELHATTVRDAVSFPNAWEQFDERGELLEQERYARRASVMLERLLWWSEALRAARRKRAYPA
ncbi:MAG TPA: NAD(P)H-dependent oxidoreductase [Noviherbaspirillum sp.]|nr:NAD(P)H-dependent oxidoreductase [Noviherbaspirillum sp.]